MLHMIFFVKNAFFVTIGLAFFPALCYIVFAIKED